MRNRSPVESLLLYASFGAASIALHLLVILGGRGDSRPITIPGLSGASAVGSAQRPPAPTARKTGDASGPARGAPAGAAPVEGQGRSGGRPS